MQSQTRSRAATAAALALVLSGGLAAGCGGDSGSAADAFIGRWYQVSPVANTPSTGFTISCADPQFSFLVPAAPAEPLFLVWPTLTFEHGVLTDLVETSGNCSPLNYNVKGNAAVPPDPDPYTKEAPACGIPFTVTDATGGSLSALFLVKPQAGWSFTLQADKGTNGAPHAKLVGTANGHVLVDDGSGMVVESNPDCVVGGQDIYERLTRP
ncbi:MAG TPA: hypothetical protein VN903_04090 [Polyangia bacterium]|jgi:hypothetical protein|nr:hypothetical protein [Polyangia bacterium]